MTYQQLDAIADSYVPLLGIMTLFWFVIKGKRSGLRSALGDASTTILGAVYIYTLMFVDKYFDAFAAIGLDYSTHTALALVFVVTLSFIGQKVRSITIISMVSYCLLMLYQGYHSVADILLTGLMTLPVLIWLKYLSYGKRKANNEFGCDL
ncbi:hypothetical protein [Vibrio harveyi]|uniref:hypothetical protein n=1 Tax=Vibrio harveyi TaxID=669 RepID=UPI001E2E5004|nr:hypothetical protein [Vibrio harveyi]